VIRKAYSKEEGKKNYNYYIISFSDTYLYSCLKRLDPISFRLCPHIEAFINNDDFEKIDIMIFK
jgi:hypothetical protein